MPCVDFKKILAPLPISLEEWAELEDESSAVLTTENYYDKKTYRQEYNDYMKEWDDND
jgi:hypothetical protein